MVFVTELGLQEEVFVVPGFKETVCSVQGHCSFAH